MRIDTTNRTSGIGRSNAAGRTGSGVDFVPAGGTAPARVASQTPMQAMAGIDSILALQAVEEPLSGKKKAVRRGASLLDMLETMKADLLVGKVDPDQLEAMIGTLGQMRERTMPELDFVLDEIELRVRVELAKFGRFPPG